MDVHSSVRDSDGRPVLPVLIVPLVHLAACIVIDGTGTGGSFDWFLMSFIDYPVFITLASMQIAATPFVMFTVLGTLWWLGLSVLFWSLYRRMVL